MLFLTTTSTIQLHVVIIVQWQSTCQWTVPGRVRLLRWRWRSWSRYDWWWGSARHCWLIHRLTQQLYGIGVGVAVGVGVGVGRRVERVGWGGWGSSRGRETGWEGGLEGSGRSRGSETGWEGGVGVVRRVERVGSGVGVGVVRRVEMLG